MVGPSQGHLRTTPPISQRAAEKGGGSPEEDPLQATWEFHLEVSQAGAGERPRPGSPTNRFGAVLEEESVSSPTKWDPTTSCPTNLKDLGRDPTLNFFKLF